MVRRQAMSVQRLANVLERAARRAHAVKALRVTTFAHVGPSHNVRRFFSAPKFFYFSNFPICAEGMSTQKHSLRRLNLMIPGNVPPSDAKYRLSLRCRIVLLEVRGVNAGKISRGSSQTSVMIKYEFPPTGPCIVGMTGMKLQQLLTVLAVTCAFALPCSVPALTQTTDADNAPVTNEITQQAIHDYILAHPEVLMQSLRIAKEREETRAAEQSKALVTSLKDDLVDDPNAPVRGNPSGDVTLVEFFDYRCPYCRQVEPFLQALIKNDRGLRVVVKELPILGSASVFAARVALAAHKQGKYEQFHNAVMSKRSNFDEATLLKLAEEAGLALDRLKTDMNSPEVDAEIKRTTEVAQALRLSGTPAFIVGTELIPGATDPETLQALLDEARHGTN